MELIPKIKDYKISKNGLLGEGSYGRVWLAMYKGEDARAVKIFKPGVIQEATWQSEYEKLKALDEPPGIVTLYDRGYTEDGQPYYAMRLMADKVEDGKIIKEQGTIAKNVQYKGRTLRSRIDNRDDSLELKWQIIMSVAETLAYIHSKDIIHCDIKPRNILLSAGEDPRPVICDFGQSRTQGSNEMRAGGTRFYASPEQLRHPEKINKSWDVYSFGVFAYEYIFDKLPRLDDLYKSEVIKNNKSLTGLDRSFDQTLLTQTQTVEIDQTQIHPEKSPNPYLKKITPLELADQIEKEGDVSFNNKNFSVEDLDKLKVILKCLAINGNNNALEKRYKNMNEVVKAFKDVDKSRALAIVHRKNIIYAILSLLGLITALMTIFQWQRANKNLVLAEEAVKEAQIQKEIAQSSEKLAQKEKERAIVSELEAKNHKKVADKLLSKADKLLGNVIYDLKEKLEPLGKTELLDQITSEAEQFFDSLPETFHKKELGTLLNNRADIFLTKGDLKKAEEFYQKSLNVRKKLLENNPEEATNHSNYAVSLDRIADLKLRYNKYDEALSLYEQSFKIKKELVKKFSGDTKIDEKELKRDLAVGFDNLGDVYHNKKDFEMALTNYFDSLKIRQELEKQYATFLEIKRDLAVVYSKIGDTYQSLNDFDNSLKIYNKAIIKYNYLIEKESQNISYLRGKSAILLNIADLHKQKNDSIAIKKYKEALENFWQIFTNDPENYGSVRDLEEVLNKTISYYEQSKRISDQDIKSIIDKLEESSNYLRDDYLLEKVGAFIYLSAGNYFMNKRNNNQALEYFDKAYFLFNQNMIKGTALGKDQKIRENLSLLLYKRGFVKTISNKKGSAKEDYKKAIEILEALKQEKNLSTDAKQWYKLIKEELKIIK